MFRLLVRVVWGPQINILTNQKCGALTMYGYMYIAFWHPPDNTNFGNIYYIYIAYTINLVGTV